jgi:hypothetical protein
MDSLPDYMEVEVRVKLMILHVRSHMVYNHSLICHHQNVLHVILEEKL